MHDYFNPELTNSVMYFEIFLAIFLVWIFVFWIKNYKFFVWKFFALSFWVFAFEWLTWALWINSNLWNFAYIHNDISWVMTLAWASIIMFSKIIFDKFWEKLPCILKYTKLKKSKNFKLIKEFIFVTIFSSILWLLLLIYLKDIWVFSYWKEMQEIINSWITVFWRPLEAIVYFPVFIFTTFSFYKYWELAMQDKNLFNDYKINFSKDILISVIIISLIWYLIHPILLVENTFVYILLLVWFVINLIITWGLISKFVDLSLFMRFIAGTFIFTTIWSFLVSFFVKYWYLDFSQSIKDTYTINTIQMPLANWITDVEWWGILLFSYLMVAIIKYFKIITDNKEIKISNKNMTFKGIKSLFINQK